MLSRMDQRDPFLLVIEAGERRRSSLTDANTRHSPLTSIEGDARGSNENDRRPTCHPVNWLSKDQMAHFCGEIRHSMRDQFSQHSTIADEQCFFMIHCELSVLSRFIVCCFHCFFHRQTTLTKTKHRQRSVEDRSYRNEHGHRTVNSTADLRLLVSEIFDQDIDGGILLGLIKRRIIGPSESIARSFPSDSREDPTDIFEQMFTNRLITWKFK